MTDDQFTAANDPAPRITRPRPGRGGLGWGGALAWGIVVLLFLGAGYWLFNMRLVNGGSSPQMQGAAPENWAGLRDAVASVEARLMDIEQLRAEQAALAERVARLEDRLSAGGAVTDPNLDRRVSILEQRALAREAGQSGADPALRGRIDALDARLNEVSGEGARLLPVSIALARLERALYEGEAYEAHLRKLDMLYPGLSEAAPAEFRTAASQGLLSYSALRAEFQTLRRTVHRAAARDPSSSWADRMLASLGETIRLRRADEARQPSLSAQLDEIDAALRAGRPEEALARFEALPDPARAPLKEWWAKLQARLQAEAALAAIETALLTRAAR